MYWTIQKIQGVIKGMPGFLGKHWLHVAALLLITVWCIPYFTTGERIEWGDFSFFAQAYEAMRISIVEYGQFPWFNPWISGGVPLYANPQMGLFSIQMLFTFFVGAPMGLKLAIVVYTFLGYGAMYLLLRKYFKVGTNVSILLSLIWIFCTFFVSHLPTHFTFVWYMLAPAYIYLALTIKDWRGGLLLGGAFAVMALSQIHNAFAHIALLCGIILLFRLMLGNGRKKLILGLAAAGGLFLLVAGHRLLMTYENVSDFPRMVSDPPQHPLIVLLGLLLPRSKAHELPISYPVDLVTGYGWHEVSATIGIFTLLALLLCGFFLVYKLWLTNGQWRTRLNALRPFRLPLAVLGLGLICLALAFGSVHPLAPYSLLKHLPVFGEMRVSTRWLIWFDLSLLIFIGLMIERLPKKSFIRFGMVTLVAVGTLELLAVNAGYQKNTFQHELVKAPLPTSAYQFNQTAYFGETRKLPGGGEIPDDGSMPDMYREYEATMYNLGVLYANDALVQLHLDPRRNPGHPTCPWEDGCEFVRSGNARVVEWSPQKIALERTAPGKIYLNMNNSNYFVINGKRSDAPKVAEPFTDFVIDEPDTVKTITIEAKPSIMTLLHNTITKP